MNRSVQNPPLESQDGKNALIHETPRSQTDRSQRPLFSRFVLFTALTLAGLSADLATKQYVFERLGLPGESDPKWIFDGLLGVQTAVNPGAVFGVGAGKGLFFAAFSVVAIIGISLWMFRFCGYQSKWLTYTLGMISGGILGNLYDRLGFWWDDHLPVEWKSGVRDWILFRIEGVPLFDPWPNFNIADALLVIGAAMLFYHSLVLDPPQSDAA